MWGELVFRIIRAIIGFIVAGVVLLSIAFVLSDNSLDDIKIFTKKEIEHDGEHRKETVKVDRVVDGDTIIVTTKKGKEERVRLLLIDTPESVHPYKDKELYGEESSDYAKEILHKGDQVTLEIGELERDQYDRLLAYVWIGKINFNKTMVEKGYARVGYVFEPNTKYLDEFLEAERRAKEKKLNIWSVKDYVTEDGFDMSVVE